ncbi:MAG: class I SAM-dependent methyltransferase [Actinomycetota bacterium]
MRSGSDPDLVAALHAIADHDWNSARSLAVAAAERAPHGLASALADGLSAGTAAGVYEDPTAFDVFISNGTNPALYAATSRHLASLHEQLEPHRVLDIGCGDGRVTAAVVGATTEHTDLVEPSEALLQQAADRMAIAGADVMLHGLGAVEFLATSDENVRWDLAQSTFAFHSLAPADRRAAMRMLSTRAQHLVLVEFDVPDASVLADRDALLRSLAERYDVGVREYRAHPNAVSGFLVPVLLGLLDPDRPRHTYEQSAAQWQSDLGDMGFTGTSVTALYDYWWSPAVAIHAST